MFCCRWLNCVLDNLTPDELYTGRLGSGWTVYWVTRLWLNCIQGDLALAELYSGWLGSGLTIIVGQKWLWWSDNGKNFNNNISGEFWCRFPVGGGNTNFPEMLLLKFLPLSDHHCHFWTTTFDFTTFFMLLFLHGPHLFLQFGCFGVVILFQN